MKERLFDKNGYIQLDEATHTYRNNTGDKYKSVSKKTEAFKQPFDADFMAPLVAKSRLDKSASQKHIELYAAQLKAEWKLLNENSTIYGHGIHLWAEKEKCDNFDIMQKINPKITWEKLISLKQTLNLHFSQYSKQYEEEILWDNETLTAGMVDKPCLRSSRSNVVDFFDYKSNIEKGIYFDSIKRDNGIWKKHYNRYYLVPFNNIEQSNYYDYCLQLSTYGLMAEKLGYKVGMLQILYIDLNLQLFPIPVPYMREEAKIVLGTCKEVKLEQSFLVDTSIVGDEENW